MSDSGTDWEELCVKGSGCPGRQVQYELTVSPGRQTVSNVLGALNPV